MFLSNDVSEIVLIPPQGLRKYKKANYYINYKLFVTFTLVKVKISINQVIECIIVKNIKLEFGKLKVNIIKCMIVGSIVR